MTKKIDILPLFIILILSVSTVTVVTILFNSPYYIGFESGLDYLSADLSEGSFIIRDEVTIKDESVIKIVFEEKDSFSNYDREQFDLFLNSLEIRIWRDGEYYSYNSNTRYNLDNNNQILIGKINGGGEYSLYIKSDYGRNISYHIGIGIGRENKKLLSSKNRRSFY